MKSVREPMWIAGVIAALAPAALPGQLRPVTNTYDWRPTWAPDGDRLAFTSPREGDYDLYIVSLDSGVETRLTRSAGDERDPRWSPDGSSIAFSANRDGNWDLWRIDVEGGDESRLTRSIGSDRAPAWSPDGRRIAFHSDRDGDAEIYVLDLGTRETVRLTDNDFADLGASWSPDGERLAFYSDLDGDYEIYTVRTDGSQRAQVTHNEVADRSVDWSPDGARLVYWSTRDDEVINLWVSNLETGQETRLTDHPDYDYSPAWSPDGRRIAFDSRRDGRRGLYVMSADGSGVRKVTNRTETEFVRVALDESAAEAVRRYYVAHQAAPRSRFVTAPELFRLVYELVDQGRAAEALQLAEFGLGTFLDQPVVLYWALGHYYESAGDPAGAHAVYGRALEIHGTDTRAAAGLARTACAVDQASMENRC